MYNSGYHVKFDTQSSHKVPISIKKNKLSIKGDFINEQLNTASYETSPIIKEDRKLIERPVIESNVHFEKMSSVEKALRSRNYESVKNLFTDEGWEIFTLLVNSGDVRVNQTPKDYIIESTPLFTIGKGIPVSIKESRILHPIQFGLIASVFHPNAS